MALSRSEQKRLDIINAAKLVFKENGVQATSMDKLAEVANVSKRTVYNHFKTKEELVMHLVKELWQKAMLSSEDDYDKTAPLAPQLTKILMKEISLMNSPDYIDLSRVAMGHFLFQPEALQVEIEKFSKQETSLQLWLENATNDGLLTVKNIELAVQQLHGLIKGSCFWPQLLGLCPLLSEQEQINLADESVAMFLARYANS
ncbi:TetR/AcrR family transcriptional regulator [Thalassotalea sp. M1531]|uniref:TetR/AcrR family transcriptional regulator n=1 Tax=Thalassotalea algicola TaxID=2716224 RepID=A0A7Y0LE11_9GAMM|nr:TetR/AcrR family transcriptional regulator [Thalassotalea algicola]NMP32818.1 TetR/AcrR family transcriptional regulator [Thalassotalea algicola]